ncbi:hypothetical protein LWI29_021042 [Acer saccharum]|uniref:Uncharacterized protein n=1 Tax=Acer saccharum TaxID=4024 RepID=A0AA39SMU9_ACESA|nr:hypothetical protein LWI29_021042 [Acer saccharum]
MEPTVMVQNLPAKESAMRAPMRGVKLAVPLKLVRVLEAGTSGMFSSCVRPQSRDSRLLAKNEWHCSYPSKLLSGILKMIMILTLLLLLLHLISSALVLVVDAQLHYLCCVVYVLKTPVKRFKTAS